MQMRAIRALVLIFLSLHVDSLPAFTISRGRVVSTQLAVPLTRPIHCKCAIALASAKRHDALRPALIMATNRPGRGEGNVEKGLRQVSKVIPN